MDSYNLSLVETQQIEKVLVKGYRATKQDYERVDSVIGNSPRIDPFCHFIKKRRRNCKYYATSVHLLCAVNPMTTTCEGCPHFEEKAS